MRALLISNPHSTSNTDGRMPGIVRALRSVEGVRLTTKFTAYPGHAAELVAGLTKRDYDAIIGIGGDGTVNEIVNGLLSSKAGSHGKSHGAATADELPTIALIPSGSANVLAGCLGIPRDPVDAAWYVAGLLRSGAHSAISVGYAEGRHFVVNAGIGIDAEVIAAMESLRRGGSRASALRYMSTVLSVWKRLRSNPPRITATVDGRVIGRDVTFAVVSNANPWTFLGDLPIVTNPALSVRKGLGFYGFSGVKGVTGLVGAANLAGSLLWLRAPLAVGKRELRVDEASEVLLESAAALRLQLDGEYIDWRKRVAISIRREAINVAARIDDFTDSQFTQKVASRPMDERLLVVVTKKLADRARRLFDSNQ